MSFIIFFSPLDHTDEIAVAPQINVLAVKPVHSKEKASLQFSQTTTIV